MKLSKAPESRANAYHALKMLTKGNSPLKKIRMSRSDVLDVQFIVSIIYSTYFSFSVWLVLRWSLFNFVPHLFTNAAKSKSGALLETDLCNRQHYLKQ